MTVSAVRHVMGVVVRTEIAFLILWTAPGCGVPAPDGPADSYGVDFSLPPKATVSGAIIFCVDGVNAEVFEEMLAEGQLPGIRDYFVERGIYAPRAVANMPSVTLANLTSLVTGQFPGHHGITGINWFDRNRLIWRNYETIAQKNTLDGDYTAPNIYEQFSHRTTFSIFFQPHRGTTKFVENWTSAGPPFFFGWYEFVDRLTLWRFNIVADVARKREAWPILTIAYLLAPDFRAYANGIGSEQYRQALQHTDRQIGRICGDLKSAGILDDLYLGLCSDHSLGEVTRHFPMDEFLYRDAGIELATRRLWEETPFEDRLAYYRRFPGVTYGSGDRYWAICLRKQIRDESGKLIGHLRWPVRPEPGDLSGYLLGRKGTPPPSSSTSARDSSDLIELLARQSPVDAVAYRSGPGRVRVRRSTGEVEFIQEGGRGAAIRYRLISGTDPLGWEGEVPDDLLGSRPVSGRRWLEATWNTDYPDLPEQIIAYFRSRLSGDIAVFAAPGWDFGHSNRAGHGGLRPQDMCVPLILTGPGLKPQKIGPARTVDLMPTLLRLLGREPPPGLDGADLLAGGK